MENKFDKIIEAIVLLSMLFGVKYIFTRMEELQGDRLEYFFKTLVILAVFTVVYSMRYIIRPSYKSVLITYKKGWKISGFYSKYALKNELLYNLSYSFWVKINLLVLVLFGGISVLLRFIPRFVFSRACFYGILGTYFSMQILCWVCTAIRSRLLYHGGNEIEKS